MSPTLMRYLAQELFKAIALATLAFVALFIFFDLLNELDGVGREGYSLRDALVYVLLLVPGRVYELLPITVLIGALYALTSLAAHSEIAVMRTAGISVLRLLGGLTLIGLVFVLMTFVIGEYVAPPAERAAKQWKLITTGAAVSQQLRSGLWIRDGRRFINVRAVTPERHLENVRIFEFDDQRRLRLLSQAKNGRYDHIREAWTLTDVTHVVFLAERTERRHQAEVLWHSELTPEVLSVLMVAPERMSVLTLYAYIQHLKNNRQDADRFEIAFWKKLMYPFASLVMLALALPFACQHSRTGSVSTKVFVGVMLGLGFYLLNGLSSNLGALQAWPPILAALMPSLLFFITALVMLYLTER